MDLIVFNFDPSSLFYSREAIPLTIQVDGFEDELEKGNGTKEQPPSLEKNIEILDPNNLDGQIHRHFILVGLNFVGIILVS